LGDDEDGDVDAVNDGRAPGGGDGGSRQFCGELARCVFDLSAESFRVLLTLAFLLGLEPRSFEFAAFRNDELLDVVEQHLVQDESSIYQRRGRCEVTIKCLDQLSQSGDAAVGVGDLELELFGLMAQRVGALALVGDLGLLVLDS
jgi:hypothetical protein